MSLYTDIRDAVFVWTNKPSLVAETDIAIKQALRTAHRAGTFYRDLVIVPITGVTIGPLQTIDLPAVAPRIRQIAYVKPANATGQYDFVDISDLYDQENYYKLDVYYGVGTDLLIRPKTPVADLELCYYRYPVTTPIESIDSWIADEHQDLIILWAAATVLALRGEQEIKTRVETLAKLAYQDLIEEATTLIRR